MMMGLDNDLTHILAWQITGLAGDLSPLLHAPLVFCSHGVVTFLVPDLFCRSEPRLFFWHLQFCVQSTFIASFFCLIFSIQIKE